MNPVTQDGMKPSPVSEQPPQPPSGREWGWPFPMLAVLVLTALLFFDQSHFREIWLGRLAAGTPIEIARRDI